MALKELEAKYAAIRSRAYKLTDGGGLHLFVQPNGSKLWRMKYRFGGKEKLLSFGKYPDVPLAAARTKRDEARVCLAEGRDPGVVRAEEQEVAARTFEKAARAWHANRSDSLNAAHAKRVLSRMESDVFPVIGHRPLTEVAVAEILAMIRKIEARGALDISRRANQCVSQVYRFAIANGWARENPTVHLLGALRPRPRVKHMARVPLHEVPDLVRSIAGYDGEDGSRRRDRTRDAMMFTLLTWARTGEVRFAVWSEIEDLDGRQPVWRVPAERMKKRREHLVPLSSQAVLILRRRKELAKATPGGFIFPGDRAGIAMSENTMLYGCYRMGYRSKQTIHGFRALGSTWANESQNYRSDWIELALAHAEDDTVRAAYNSAQHLTQRSRMLQDWGNYVDNCGRPENGIATSSGADRNEFSDNQVTRPEGEAPRLILRVVGQDREASDNVIKFPVRSRCPRNC
nr:integrase arm-type DNA-binding domain-containing protein [uncultured Novosphingobium sp.]